MVKRLKILPSVKAAYRQSWCERREIFQVSWLAVLLSFCLLTLPIFLSALKVICQIADQILLSVIFVCLLRKYLLDEKPKFRKGGGVLFYMRFVRREVIYAAWSIALMLITLLTEKAADIMNVIPIVGYDMGPFVGSLGSWVWSSVNFTLFCMPILIGPYIAVAPKPAIGDFPGLIEPLIGNIANVMVAIFVIFAPLNIMAILFYFFSPPQRAMYYAEHAVFLICSIVEIKFVGTVYKNLYPAS